MASWIALCPIFFFLLSQEIVRCIYSLVQVIDSGGGNGYISRYTNYRIIHLCLFPRISKSKILTARSQEKQRSNRVNGNSFTGIAKPPRYKIEVLMESFARFEEKKEKRRSMNGDFIIFNQEQFSIFLSRATFSLTSRVESVRSLLCQVSRADIQSLSFSQSLYPSHRRLFPISIPMKTREFFIFFFFFNSLYFSARKWK